MATIPLEYLPGNVEGGVAISPSSWVKANPNPTLHELTEYMFPLP